MKFTRLFVPLLAAISIFPSFLSAQNLRVLYDFPNSAHAPIPLGRLTLAGNTLYGTAAYYGSNYAGIVYGVNIDGSGFSVLHDFSSDTNGGVPEGGLLLSGDTLYGTTALGGTNGPWGTVFSLKTNGTSFNLLHSFTSDPAIGQHPHPQLSMEGSTLYGVASGQGSPGWGSLFSIQSDGGEFNSFYTFTTPKQSGPDTNIDGEQPQGALIPDSGTLYGTAYGGGPAGYGTVFSVSPDGNNFTVLHAFTNNPDGAYLRGGLILADGVLYGTTSLGGSNNQGTVFSVQKDGAGYQILHSFAGNGVDGSNPWTGLVLWHHTLYGTTERGGTNGHGTIFSINTNGSAYTVFHQFILASGSFTNIEGTEPQGELMISGNTLYGTTQRGGSSGSGTVFGLTLPRPGIKEMRISGNNVVFDATNGVPGETYALLTSSEPSSPGVQWTAIATNTANADGNIAFAATDPVGPATRQRFYVLQMQ
jgi:uncharacterized repeat protein (TIGR03803 family)